MICLLYVVRDLMDRDSPSVLEHDIVIVMLDI